MGYPSKVNFMVEFAIIKARVFYNSVELISLSYYKISIFKLYLVKNDKPCFIIFHINMKYMCR